ncbi:MAG: pilus assembly protein [Planctomycetales bacterium]|nr:pilus assembly protein [Planctomycetales bacterium]
MNNLNQEELKISNRRGVSTLELAVLIPVLAIAAFVAIEYGQLRMTQQTMDNAAYEAARHAIVPGASAGEAKVVAEEILHSVGIDQAKIRVSPDPISEETSAVSVQITVPAEETGWVTPQFLHGNNLETTATLAAERAMHAKPESGDDPDDVD